MAVTVSWYDETHRVITQRYESKWTWEDLTYASQETRNLAITVPHPVILLIDLSKGIQMPSGNALAQGRSAFNALPDGVSQVYVALRSQMMEIFGELVVKMLPQWRNRVQFTKTFDEAEKLMLEFIAKDTPET